MLRSRQPPTLSVEGRFGAGLPRNRVAGAVVGMPGLALKGEKDRHPAVGTGKPEQKTTITPHAIVAGMAAGPRISLVHVNVVDAAIGFEFESLVRLVLGTPGLAKGEDDGVGIALCPLDLRVDQIVEIVPLTRHIGRQEAHVFRVEQMSSNIVEPAILQTRNDRVEPSLKFFTVGKIGCRKSSTMR